MEGILWRRRGWWYRKESDQCRSKPLNRQEGSRIKTTQKLKALIFFGDMVFLWVICISVLTRPVQGVCPCVSCSAHRTVKRDEPGTEESRVRGGQKVAARSLNSSDLGFTLGLCWIGSPWINKCSYLHFSHRYLQDPNFDSVNWQGLGGTKKVLAQYSWSVFLPHFPWFIAVSKNSSLW